MATGRAGKRSGGSAAKKRRARKRKTGTGPGKRNGDGGNAKGGGSGGPSWGAEWLKASVLALFLFFVLRLFILQTFVITSGSMENTLLVGDFLVVNRAAIGSRVPFTGIRIPGYSEPRRGTCWSLTPSQRDMTLVKAPRRHAAHHPGNAADKVLTERRAPGRAVRGDDPRPRHPGPDDALAA